MKKSKKLKTILGLFYLLVVSSFLYFLISRFSLADISSIKIIQLNAGKLNELKNNNLLWLSIFFFIFTILWVSLLGFGSPIILISGFVFGKWVGTILATLSLSVGALCLYLIGKYFFMNF